MLKNSPKKTSYSLPGSEDPADYPDRGNQTNEIRQEAQF
jgi:hypothetical protein